MSIFAPLSTLFSTKARLDHPNPDKRIIAVDQLNDSDHTEFLRVVREDKDTRVRLRAFERLRGVESIALFIDDKDLGTKAISRLVNEIDDSSKLFDEPGIFTAYLNALDDPKRIVDFVLGKVDKPRAATLLMLESRSELRPNIVDTIDNHELLMHCEKLLRGKGNPLYTTIHRKVVAIKQLLDDKNVAVAEAERILQAVDRISLTDKHYMKVHEAYQSRWNDVLETIESLDEDLSRHGVAKLDLDMLRARFPQSVAVDGETKQAAPIFREIIEKFNATAKSREEIDDAETAWLDALKHAKPPEDLANEFESNVQRANSNLAVESATSQFSQRLAPHVLPYELDRPTTRSGWRDLYRQREKASRRIEGINEMIVEVERITHSRAHQETWRRQLFTARTSCTTAIENMDKWLDETRDEIDELSGKFESLMEEGNLALALPVEREIRDRYDRLPRTEREQDSEEIAIRAATISENLRWRNFGAQFKREKLCEEIEELAESPLDPPDQLKAMKALRQAWLELGPSIPRRDLRLQIRYDKAASEAYKVCKEWFDQLSLLRKANLATRKKLCEQLVELHESTDWDNANWRDVIRVLRSSKAEYHDAFPVENTATKEMNKQFYGVAREIQAKITAHYNANLTQKRGLIEEAQAAIDDEQMSQADRIDVFKRLQATWKTIGPTRRKDEKLWQQFKEVCDLAFAQLDKERQDRRQNIAQNIEQANESLDELKKLQKSNDDAFNQARIAAVRRELDDLVLPKRVSTRVDRVLRELDHAVLQRDHDEKQRTAGQALFDLLALDEELAACEVEEKNVTEDWFIKASQYSVWFETRVSEVDPRKLRDLVLKAELAAEIPAQSSEDESRRLELRVQDLQETMGREKQEAIEIAETLIEQWVGTAYGEQPMRSRFREAIRRLLALENAA